MRIVLVDNHPLERSALASILAGVGMDIEVVGQAITASQALIVINETSPDVVLLDLKLSDAEGAREDEGLDVAEALRATKPEIGILIRSAYAQPAYAQRLLEIAGPRGGVGYMRKGGEGKLDDLVRTIKDVARGEIAIDPAIVRTLMGRARPNADPLSLLSPKERIVLEHIARGESNSKISQELGCKVATVERDASSIFAKLGITTGSIDERRGQNARVIAALTFLRFIPPQRNPASLTRLTDRPS